MMAPPTMYPRPRTRLRVLAMVVVLIIVLGSVGCALVMYTNPMLYTDVYYGKGHQTYQGTPNGTQLMFTLSKDGFKPQLEAGYSGVRIYFVPYCGNNGSAEATRSLGVMRQSYMDFDSGNNTTTVVFTTERVTDSTYSSHNITEILRCVMAKTKAILTTEFGLKVLTDDSSKQKYYMPGFDTILVVPAMVVISLVWRRHLKARKK